MKIPASAPENDLEPAWFDMEPFRKLLGAVRQAEVDGHYIHWDSLRRRPPPFGATHEQWWWAIAMNRSSLRVPLPFKAAGRWPELWFARTESLERGLHRIDRSLGGRLETAEPDLTNEELRDSFILRSFAEEAITSSQLEGASTTRRVAKDMLLSGRAPVTRSERMIANNFQAMSRVRELRSSPLTPGVVFELQQILTQGTLPPEDVHRFRRADESVTVQDNSSGQVLYVPPMASELDARLQALCAFANQVDDERTFIHPVICAILLHFMLAYDHPFVDGNGRTARALFYWSLLRHNYWGAEYLSISRIIRKAPAAYGRAFLYTETDRSDVTYFLLHQVGVIQEAADDLFLYLEQNRRQLREAEKRFAKAGRFNPRQQRVLMDALHDSRARYTIEGHQREFGVVYQTARADLLKLEEAGLLRREAHGKKFIFSPAPGLRNR